MLGDGAASAGPTPGGAGRVHAPGAMAARLAARRTALCECPAVERQGIGGMSLSGFRLTCVVSVLAALAVSLTAPTASAAAPQGVELQDFGVSPAVADLGPSASSDSSGGAARLNPLGSSPRTGARGAVEGGSSQSDRLAARGSETALTPAR